MASNNQTLSTRPHEQALISTALQTLVKVRSDSSYHMLLVSSPPATRAKELRKQSRPKTQAMATVARGKVCWTGHQALEERHTNCRHGATMLASRPAKAQVKDDTDSCLHVPKETLRISMDSDEHPRLQPMGLAIVMRIPMTSRNK